MSPATSRPAPRPGCTSLDVPLALVASSERWGVAKPDPAFFARICAELGARPRSDRLRRRSPRQRRRPGRGGGHGRGVHPTRPVGDHPVSHARAVRRRRDRLDRLLGGTCRISSGTWPLDKAAPIAPWFACTMPVTPTFVERETVRRMRRMQSAPATTSAECERMLASACPHLRRSPGSTRRISRGSRPVGPTRASRSSRPLGSVLERTSVCRYFDGAGSEAARSLSGGNDRGAPGESSIRDGMSARGYRCGAEGCHRCRAERPDQALPSSRPKIQSELRRLEQQIRWCAEKAEGLAQQMTPPEASPPEFDPVSRLLDLAIDRLDARTGQDSSRRPSRRLTRHGHEDVVTALTTSDVPWPGDGIVWMHLEGRRCNRHGPPTTGCPARSLMSPAASERAPWTRGQQ